MGSPTIEDLVPQSEYDVRIRLKVMADKVGGEFDVDDMIHEALAMVMDRILDYNITELKCKDPGAQDMRRFPPDEPALPWMEHYRPGIDGSSLGFE